MKKQNKMIFKILPLFFTAVLLFSACGANGDDAATSAVADDIETSETTENVLDAVDVLYEEGEHYKIYSNAEKTLYRYDVLDSTGALIDQGYQDWHGVSFTGDENILQLFYWYSGPLSLVRYYDIETGRVSRLFSNSLGTHEETVAYFSVRGNDILLVVQNMFEPATFYREFDRDFSGMVIRGGDCKPEFLQNGKKLKLTYWRGENDEEVTEIFDLR